MDERVISVDHGNGSLNMNTGFNQHYKQHFQQHYTATSDGLSQIQHPLHQPMPLPLPPIVAQPAPPFQQYESRSQLIETDADGNTRKVEEKREHSSKKTVQTTTTTTMSQQPVIVTSDNELLGPPSPYQYHHGYNQTIVHPVQPVYAINDTNNYLTSASTVEPSSGGITVEHYPNNARGFSWSNVDTYLHIFLTFYFGHFAAMLFFDGIIRNFVNLYLFEHRNLSMLIYIFHIILSIALLAFTVWFMTICWRWWRHKSILPLYYSGAPVRPLGPKERQATFHGYVFTAALLLIVGFFCFLILGILDLSFKYELQQTSQQCLYGRYNNAAYIGDCVVFLLRALFWIVGIVATLLLSRETLYKYFCPSRRIKINKEKPTTVYQVRE